MIDDPEQDRARDSSADDFSVRRLEAEVLSLEDERDRRTASSSTNAQRPKRAGKRSADLTATVRAKSKLATIALTIGGDVIGWVRPGGIVTLLGASGRGKTSLAATIAAEHARDVGPAIIYSLELPAHEFGARIIGLRSDESWLNVLEGKLPDEQMTRAIPERISIIDRSEAALDLLVVEILAMKTEYPTQPIIVVVDYVQLVETPGVRPGEMRASTDAAMRAIDRVARAHDVLVLALTQGSRASAKALAAGELTGAQTTDGGAESAAIERWASGTLAIGEHGERAQDGSCASSIHTGKMRMQRDGAVGGDAVFPARYYGRSGLWRLTDEAKPASEVRTAKEQARAEAAERSLELQLIGAAERSNEPLSRDQLATSVTGRNKNKRQAIEKLLGTGELVEVGRRASRSRAWTIWTANRMTAAGLKLASDVEAMRS